MRSTPQRRAILSAFRGGATEHLSADEIYARAAVQSPDLGRGTVYATLAEFSESGLLATVGVPEPVRYELNTTEHAHLRCTLCLRIFDVDAPPPDIAPFDALGHQVLGVELNAEGVCTECVAFRTGLSIGIARVLEAGADTALDLAADVAVAEYASPVGTLLLAATSDGLARLAFPEHADVAALRARIGQPASPEARSHLDNGTAALERYFGSEPAGAPCAVDWKHVGNETLLSATLGVPYGSRRSYHGLGVEADPEEMGEAFAANPVPIILPCHRVICGAVVPEMFNGGAERRAWLLEHERQTLER